jgi:hypothetical protein
VVWGSMDWTALSQDTESLRTLVNEVMKLWVKHNAGLAKDMLACQKGLCSTELIRKLIN